MSILWLMWSCTVCGGLQGRTLFMLYPFMAFNRPIVRLTFSGRVNNLAGLEMEGKIWKEQHSWHALPVVSIYK